MKIPFILLLSLLFFLHCKPDDEGPDFVCTDELPCIEEAISSLCAAYKNGEVWESEAPPFGVIRKDQSTYHISEKKFVLLFNLKDESIRQGIGLVLMDQEDIGNFIPDSSSIFLDKQSICLDSTGNGDIYDIDADFDNLVNLTEFDFDNRVARGYFKSRFINQSCNDTVTFTEGRFVSFFSIE